MFFLRILLSNEDKIIPFKVLAVLGTDIDACISQKEPRGFGH